MFTVKYIQKANHQKWMEEYIVISMVSMHKIKILEENLAFVDDFEVFLTFVRFSSTVRELLEILFL